MKRFGTRCYNFIMDADLIDVDIGGYSFTWTNRPASKMRKTDRFLVSYFFIDIFVEVSAVVLDKFILDHRLIFLKENVVNFGPTPFWFFNSWLNMDGFYEFVVHTWNSMNSLMLTVWWLQKRNFSFSTWLFENEILMIVRCTRQKKIILSVIAAIDVLVNNGLA